MERLREIIRKKSFLILGVGNRERGDDYIGSYVLSKLKTKNKIDCGPVPENFTGQIRALNPEVIILLDAVDFGGKPGERIFTRAENAGGVLLSTHAMPLSLFCKMFPDSEVYLLGIQPESFKAISKKAKAGGEELARELNAVLE